MRDELPRALFLGSERHDLNRVPACGVIFVEYVYIRLHDVFERLRALVRGGDKGTFQMDAEKPRARFRSRFAVFLHRLHRGEDIFPALRHRRGEERRRALARDGIRDRFERGQGAVHGVRAARAVDVFVDESGKDRRVFGKRNDVRAFRVAADILDLPVEDKVAPFYSLALDVYGAFLKAFIFASPGRLRPSIKKLFKQRPPFLTPKRRL